MIATFQDLPFLDTSTRSFFLFLASLSIPAIFGTDSLTKFVLEHSVASGVVASALLLIAVVNLFRDETMVTLLEAYESPEDSKGIRYQGNLSPQSRFQEVKAKFEAPSKRRMRTKKRQAAASDSSLSPHPPAGGARKKTPLRKCYVKEKEVRSGRLNAVGPTAKVQPEVRATSEDSAGRNPGRRPSWPHRQESEERQQETRDKNPLPTPENQTVAAIPRENLCHDCAKLSPHHFPPLPPKRPLQAYKPKCFYFHPPPVNVNRCGCGEGETKSSLSPGAGGVVTASLFIKAFLYTLMFLFLLSALTEATLTATESMGISAVSRKLRFLKCHILHVCNSGN